MREMKHTNRREGKGTDARSHTCHRQKTRKLWIAWRKSQWLQLTRTRLIKQFRRRKSRASAQSNFFDFLFFIFLFYFFNTLRKVVKWTVKTRRTRACRHFKRAWAIEMVWALKWAWAKEISGPLLVGLTNGPKNEQARHTNGLGLRVLGFVNDTSPMG